MANANRKLQTAKQFADLSERGTEWLADVAQALKENSSYGIDWNNETEVTDENGVINGQNFTAAQLSNAIGALDQFRKLANNEVTGQADYLGVLNQLAEPN